MKNFSILLTCIILSLSLTSCFFEKGDKGDKGDTGAQGAQGVKGETGIQGEAGRGILNVEIIDGYLWITYTDAPNTPINIGKIVADEEGVGDGLEYYPLPDGSYSVAVGRAKYLERITIPAIHGGAPVTRIEAYAFDGLQNLKEVIIPDGITHIGDCAFRGCTSLESITVPESVVKIGSGVFDGCTSLRNITLPFISASSDSETDGSLSYLFGANIPESLTDVTLTGTKTVADYAFKGCTKIQSITLSDTVTEIGNEAFYGCTSLSEVNLGSNLTSIGSSAFRGCSSLKSISLPDTVESISKYAFAYCSKLTEITLPASLGEIACGCFENCAALSSVSIPDSVTTVGEYAFNNCDALTRVKIGNAVSTIANYAFYDCSNLVSITLPECLESIGNNSFQFCNKLAEVVNKSASLNITAGSLGNGYLGYYAMLVHSSDSKTVEENGYLFLNCEGINYLLGYTGADTELILPESFGNESYEIYKYAFAGNESISSVIIPDSVSRVGYRAFYSCYNLSIKCEAIALPSEWDSAWNASNRPVSWGYTYQ